MKLTTKNDFQEALVGELTGELGEKLTIICHGLADTKDNPTFIRLAEELQPSFRFDFSGNGESEGMFEDSTYHKQVQDLNAVLNHFTKEGVKEFCLVGHSMGGGVVQVVAQDARVTALISLAGVSKADSFKEKFPEILKKVKEGKPAFFFGKEKYPVTQKYIDSANTIDIMAAAPNVHATALALQGSDDAAIRAGQSKEWLEAMPDDTTTMFVELPGLDHRFNRTKENAKESLQLLVDVIKPWWEAHF
jgi:pimeloyl-ACP methyl ester carboxylesterase